MLRNHQLEALAGERQAAGSQRSAPSSIRVVDREIRPLRSASAAAVPARRLRVRADVQAPDAVHAAENRFQHRQLTPQQGLQRAVA